MRVPGKAEGPVVKAVQHQVCSLLRPPQHHVAKAGSRARQKMEGKLHLPGRAMQAREHRMCPSGGMVDAGDSKSPAERRAGSSPALGTTLFSGFSVK